MVTRFLIKGNKGGVISIVKLQKKSKMIRAKNWRSAINKFAGKGTWENAKKGRVYRIPGIELKRKKR